MPHSLELEVPEFVNKASCRWTGQLWILKQSLHKLSLCAHLVLLPTGGQTREQVFPLGENQAPRESREIARLTLEGPCSTRDPTWASEWHLERLLELISGSGGERDPSSGEG